MTLNALALSIGSLPPVFWAAVIAALITAALALLGVVVSNRSNSSRLRTQLQHDTLEKSRERISQMRRGIYMQVASDMSSALAHLGNIPQLDPRTENLTAPLLAFNATSAQIQLISESRTASLCAEVGNRLTSVFFNMLTKAQPMFNLKIQAESHESMRAFAQREFDQLISKAKSLDNSPEATPIRERILKSLDIYQKKIESHSASMVECMEKKLQLQSQYGAELLDAIKPIVEAQVPLMVGIRKELELTSDVAELEARTNAGFAEFKAMISKAHSRPEQ